ncbi:MAG: Lipoprotein signal peptidase [candidate division TM6 bacterium GW2011_GWF2_28_16]|nr:MAG: Lipoprotein signal peptidase [candidate division TM6 bacterium GW2011_GWF2_28_16]
MKYSFRERFLYFSLPLYFLGLDQVTKYFALKYLYLPGRVINIFNGFSLSATINRGVSFGLLNFNQDILFYLLTVVIFLVILLFAIFTYIEAKKNIFIFFNMLIISGACSNLLDRIAYKGVIDFLDFYYLNWHFPTFNIADICIVIGVFGLLGRIFYYDYIKKY